MSEPSQAPPGWYPDHTGQLRWWTGAVWGVYAQAAAPVAMPTGPPYPGAMPGARSDATTLAMLAHLGMLVGGFIVPLVIYLTSGKDDPFVRHHSAEALNFSITYVFAALACMVMFFVGIVAWPLLIVAFFGLFAIAIGHLVLLIMASVKAYHGEWWRYPVNIRLVPGAYGS
ncbi:MAG: DUF4870 domain-containing protein [Acidimicrobiales bacterium]